MRWLIVIALLAGRAHADNPVALAQAWWNAGDKAGTVDFFVNAEIETKPTCKALRHGKATDKAAQAKLRKCVGEVQKELGTQELAWKAGKPKDVATTNSSLKPTKGDRIASASATLSGIDLWLYFAIDGKGVVRRVWVTESYFE